MDNIGLQFVNIWKQESMAMKWNNGLIVKKKICRNVWIIKDSCYWIQYNIQKMKSIRGRLDHNRKNREDYKQASRGKYCAYDRHSTCYGTVNVMNLESNCTCSTLISKWSTFDGVIRHKIAHEMKKWMCRRRPKDW